MFAEQHSMVLSFKQASESTEGLVKTLIPGPHPGARGGALEPTFPTSSQVLLMLNWVPQFANWGPERINIPILFYLIKTNK